MITFSLILKYDKALDSASIRLFRYTGLKMYDPENEPEPPRVEQVNDFLCCSAIVTTGDRDSVLE